MASSQQLGTLIVTGASRGIGAAIARLAATRGYAVAVNFSSSATEAQSIVDEIVSAEGRAIAIEANVSREDDIVRMFQTVDRELGPIKALVNNAGVTGGFARVEEVTAEAIREVFAVNVTGTILCSREAVRRMSTRRGGSGGAIVNISSRAAHTGSAGEWVHYAASKGAIDSFTIGLAREVATEGIRVNAVAPGLVDTDLHASNGEPGRLQRLMPTIPMQRAGNPDEIAEACSGCCRPQLLTRPARSFELAADGNISRSINSEQRARNVANKPSNSISSFPSFAAFPCGLAVKSCSAHAPLGKRILSRGLKALNRRVRKEKPRRDVKKRSTDSAARSPLPLKITFDLLRQA
jgi:NAD(P)-dependent dehydrogenase (short-subunit alcohol dehydrogenase family)